MNKLAFIFVFFGAIVNGCKCSNITDYSNETYRVNTEVPYSYTIFRDERGFDNKTVLYYLHGSDGNDASWIKKHAGIINAWRKSGKISPIVIGISFGKRWLLVPKNNLAEESGYLELFVEQVIPEIEKRLLGRVEHRYVMGFSLGGFNAAQLVFRYPELFEKAVIVSPMLYPVSYYSSVKDFDYFINQTDVQITKNKSWNVKSLFGNNSIRNSIARNFSVLKKKYFLNEDSWNKTDILKNIKRPIKNKPSKIYISCGGQDENGFYPGSRQLADKAVSLLYPVTFRTLSGSHMAICEEEIATFLLE